MILLIRHAEAAASWGTHPDPGLSDLGQAQAERLADRLLREYDVSGIISSPMQRCQQTAAPFSRRRGLSTQIASEVSEIPTPPDVPDRREWLNTILSGQWAHMPDTIIAWRQRLMTCLSQLPDHSAVFTHFVAINAIIAGLENHDTVRVFNPGHTSITLLDRDDSGLLVISRQDQIAGQIL